MKNILMVLLLIAALINPVLVVSGSDAPMAEKPAKAKKVKHKNVQKTTVKKQSKNQENKNTGPSETK